MAGSFRTTPDRVPEYMGARTGGPHDVSELVVPSSRFEVLTHAERGVTRGRLWHGCGCRRSAAARVGGSVPDAVSGSRRHPVAGACIVGVRRDRPGRAT